MKGSHAQTRVAGIGCLLATKRYAHIRYGLDPNVLGVGIGTKLKRLVKSGNNRSIEPVMCIQFFVRRKRRGPRRPIPKFVYYRRPDGCIDYRCRVATDVIEVGTIASACRSGSPLDSNRDHGLVTLIFANAAEAGSPQYLLSCAHVVGDLFRSPPAYDELRIKEWGPDPFARTIVNSTARSGQVEYDIGLARLAPDASVRRPLLVREETSPLKSFLPAASIRQGLVVELCLRNSTTRGAVDSVETTASVDYGTGTFDVHHLCGVQVRATRGDSGALVYSDSRAVGIVVAASPAGWVWFQPLEPAVDFLRGIALVEFEVFKPKKPTQ